MNISVAKLSVGLSEIEAAHEAPASVLINTFPACDGIPLNRR
jgi:hypothetical protein